jgi:hypothetical protein
VSTRCDGFACLPVYQLYSIISSNSKFDSVGHLALNLARALARNNTSSKSMIKSKSKTKASRKDNTLLNLELLDHQVIEYIITENKPLGQQF